MGGGGEKGVERRVRTRAIRLLPWLRILCGSKKLAHQVNFGKRALGALSRDKILNLTVT